MIVVITEEAEADLERIADYIAADNPRRAGIFVQDLLDRCFRLAETPYAFPLVPRYEHTEIRRRLHGQYLIFYRVGPESIDVLHIVNGARDYEVILFPDKRSR